MGETQKIVKSLAQGVFYAGMLALLISRAAGSNISHDENQFIAPGQFLVYDGLVPYVDYPYTHMPYAVPFYALSALASEYDLLAGRLLSATFWFGSIILMAAMARSVSRSGATRHGSTSWRRLLWEFVVVLAFVHDPTAEFILRTALNHSIATFFGLLGVFCFVRGVNANSYTRQAAVLSGACIAAAGLTRFNYASLVVVLLAGWIVLALRSSRRRWTHVATEFTVGALVASLPAILLAALAPRQFYYGNIVYIRLNAVYYEQILHRTGMNVASKLSGFTSLLRAEPLQVILYAALLFTIIAAVMQARRRSAELDIARMTIAAAAIVLWMSAFAPTPSLLQYLGAPLPYLLILVSSTQIRIPRFEAPVRTACALTAAALVVIATVQQNPLADLARLGQPKDWPPVQVHELAETISEAVPEGRVLTLQSMVPLEAGLDAYPFTATGPFSWRTSPLLTAERRAEYEVISPEELESVLGTQPPAAILVGFEEPNPGFGRKDMGGLERPFSEFAFRQGYAAEGLLPPFWSRGLTLWFKP